MNVLPFPSMYKTALTKGSKNTTIRFGNESDKYKEGEIYETSSYLGDKWGIKVKVIQVIPTSLGNLSRSYFKTSLRQIMIQAS